MSSAWRGKDSTLKIVLKSQLSSLINTTSTIDTTFYKNSLQQYYQPQQEYQQQHQQPLLVDVSLSHINQHNKNFLISITHPSINIEAKSLSHHYINHDVINDKNIVTFTNITNQFVKKYLKKHEQLKKYQKGDKTQLTDQQHYQKNLYYRLVSTPKFGRLILNKKTLKTGNYFSSQHILYNQLSYKPSPHLKSDLQTSNCSDVMIFKVIYSQDPQEIDTIEHFFNTTLQDEDEDEEDELDEEEEEESHDNDDEFKGEGEKEEVNEHLPDKLFLLRVHMFKKQEATLTYLTNNPGMSIVERNLKLIGRKELLVVSDDVAPRDLIFHIKTPPNHGTLILTLNKHNTSSVDDEEVYNEVIHKLHHTDNMPKKEHVTETANHKLLFNINTFTQEQIDKGSLSYLQLTPTNHDAFYFSVSSPQKHGNFKVFNIDIAPLTFRLPSDVINVPIKQVAIRCLITNEHLNPVVNGDRKYIVYHVISSPQHGSLYR